VDFAPYLFRGKVCGFLTRLSATGLANVTSGGGQIPAFRVHARAVIGWKNLRGTSTKILQSDVKIDVKLIVMNFGKSQLN